MDYDELFDLALIYIKKLLSPEDWIKIDISFSKSELFAIMIADRRGEITMTELADFINVPMSTATGIIERLVKKGYLERLRNESDRRIVSIKLTEKGKGLVDEIKSKVMGYIKLIGAQLSEEEIRFLYNLFNKIVGILEGRTEKREKAEEENKVRQINIE